MVKSFQLIFEAQIINKSTQQPVEEIKTADKNYAIVEKDMTFSIKIQSKYPKKYFATRLFIDGNQVSSYRIFKSQQTYFGFNVGSGEFKEFKFSLPNYSFEYHEQTTTQQKQQGLIGTIRIEFFDTVEYQIHGKIQKKESQAPTVKRNFEDPCLYIDKKNIQKTLAVRMGSSVKSGPSEDAFKKMQKARYNPVTKKSIQYKADSKSQIDEIIIKYADFGQLLFTNLLSLYNENHLKYIPITLLTNNAYLLSEIIKGFLMKITKKSLSVHEIEERIVEYTGKRIKELVPDGITAVNGKGLWIRKGRIGMIENQNVINETVKQISNYQAASRKKGDLIQLD